MISRTVGKAAGDVGSIQHSVFDFEHDSIERSPPFEITSVLTLNYNLEYIMS